MKKSCATYLIAACALITWAGVPFNAQAQSEASALSAVSALPVASVVVGASATVGAAASAVVAIPVVLSTESLACPEPVEVSKGRRVLGTLGGGFDRLSPNGEKL